MLPERSPPISTISMATRVGRPCFFLTTPWHTLWLVSDINAFLSIPSSRGSILSLLQPGTGCEEEKTLSIHRSQSCPPRFPVQPAELRAELRTGNVCLSQAEGDQTQTAPGVSPIFSGPHRRKKQAMSPTKRSRNLLHLCSYCPKLQSGFPGQHWAGFFQICLVRVTLHSSGMVTNSEEAVIKCYPLVT